MALLMKLENVVTNKGKLVYRRRIPADLRAFYPKTFFETRFQRQETGPAFVDEHHAYELAYAAMVDAARKRQPEALALEGLDCYIQKARVKLHDPRTDREKWPDYLREAEKMLLPVQGGRSLFDDGGDAQRREIVADEIERVGGDPLLHRAVIHPHAELPPPTVADAARLYEKERLGPNPKKSAKDTFNRVVRRLEVSLGPLGDLPFDSLTRDQARKVRDDLLATPKKSGQGLLLVSSVQRELNSIKAMIALGIMEHDLKGEVSNPFENLSMPASNRKGFVSEWEERDPLPDEILIAVRRRILMRTRRPDLKLIWRLLQATGCRGAEITGLQIADVVIDVPVPHLWVRWNAERQLKTKTSTRPIPLIGDGLHAAKEALKGTSEAEKCSAALFPYYVHEGGPDAASGALMNHVRNVTKNPRHVVYSLRHNIKSWLGQSGALERHENRLLGHAEAAVGNRYYGGLEDRLRGTSAALEAALALAPEGAWRTDY